MVTMSDKKKPFEETEEERKDRYERALKEVSEHEESEEKPPDSGIFKKVKALISKIKPVI